LVGATLREVSVIGLIVSVAERVMDSKLAEIVAVA
jgi:hypothetical protein